MPATYPYRQRFAGRDVSGDADVANRAQSQTLDVLKDVLASLLIDARLHEDVAIGTGDTHFYHGLGTEPRGWFVVRKAVNTTVYEGTTSTRPDLFINLKAGSACTVSLVVF